MFRQLSLALIAVLALSGGGVAFAQLSDPYTARKWANIPSKPVPQEIIEQEKARERERAQPKIDISWMTREERFMFFMMLMTPSPEPTVVYVPTPAPAPAYRNPAPPYSATFFNSGMVGFFNDNRGNSGTITDVGVQRSYNFTGPDFQGGR